MAHLRLTLIFIFILNFILRCWLQTPVVCPQTCNCNGSDLLPVSTISYTKCEDDDKTFFFKYDPFKGTLYPLNQDAVNAKILNQFHGLQYLFIDDLNLTSIDPNLLDTQTEISILSLTGNNFSEISPTVFARLSKTWSIVLSNNNLKRLPLFKLPNPKILKRIFFSGNYIELSHDTFNLYSNLEWLFLSRNNLTWLPPYLIFNLPLLRSFDVSENRLTFIPPFFFSRSKYLTRLDLSYNNLISLPDSFSWGLFTLRELMLSYNDLTALSDSNFDCLWKVQNLTLNHNKLNFFSKLSFNFLTDLFYLDLNHNEIEVNNLPILPSKIIMLNLAHNSIFELYHGDWSSKLQLLTDLDLSYNNMTYLSVDELNFILKTVKTNPYVKNYNGRKGREPKHTQINLNNNLITQINLQVFVNEINHDSNPTEIYLNANPITDKCLCEIENVNNSSFKFIFDKLKCKNQTSCNQMVQGCPRNCTCLSNGVLDCSNFFFMEIPKEIIFFPTVLSMNFNNISNLSSLLDPIFHNLTGLYMNSCFLNSKSLTLSSNQSIFMKLNKLKKLFLTHNLISNLHKNFYQGLENLEHLDLSFNQIEYIPEDLISNFKSLIILNLEQNKLNALGLDHAQSHLNLEIINLKSNEIENLDNILPLLVNITHLDASFNKITQINTYKWPKKSQIISLNNNKINIKEPLKFPINSKIIDLSSNQLESYSNQYFNLSNGTILDLRKNRINSVNIEPNNGKYYQILLSENLLNCSCSLKEFVDYVKQPKGSALVEFPGNLQCSGNDTNSKPKSILETQLETCDKCPEFCVCFPNRHLECSKFPFITNYVTTSTPDSMIIGGDAPEEDGGDEIFWSSLTLQNVSYDSLKNLESQIWRNLGILNIVSCIGSIREFSTFKLGNKTALSQFSFIKNHISYLPSNLLNNATDLKTLNLSENGIRVLPVNLFKFSEKIEILDLSYNTISEINDNLLSKLLLLEKLNINNNIIDKISSDMLKNNRNLQYLNTANNRLIKLNPNAFISCSVMIELNLEENYIGIEELNSLHLPSTLKSLNLAHNKITQFISNWKYLQKLEKLTLSYNLITSISVQDLIGYPDSLKIDLSFNNISNINYNKQLLQTHDLSSKPSVQLSQQINCNCKIKWLVKCFKSKQINSCPVNIIDSDLTCKSPENVKNELVRELNEEELTCELTNCSPNCKCFVKSFDFVNCLNANLTQLPQIVPEGVDVLILDGNVNISLIGLKEFKWENLKQFYMSFCYNLNESEFDMLFERNLELEVVWMMYDGIEQLPEHFFKGLNKLRDVNLSGNKLKMLSSFKDLINIEKLNVSDNNLHVMDAYLLTKLPQIQILDFSGNRIKMVSIDILEMSDNNISDIYLSLSQNELENFTISLNLIDNVTEFQFPFKQLDLSHNSLREINFKHLFPYMKETKINLTDNLLNNLQLPVSNEFYNNLTIDISLNPISCDCLFIEEQLERNQFEIITDLNCSEQIQNKLNTLFPDSICIISSNCDFCTCIKHITTGQSSMFCSNSLIETLPLTVPDNLITLSIKNTSISILKGLNNAHFSQLRSLILSRNNIEEINNEVLPLNLKFIELDNNKLKRPSGWLSNYQLMSSLSLHLTLGHNPWICDCDNEEFRKWLLKVGHTTVSDIANITCDKGEEFILNELCDNFWVITGPILVTALVLLVISIFVLSFYCKNRPAVLMWFYSKCVCFRKYITEEEIEVDRIFDAFVSYANEDSDFVTEMLLPELEEKEPFYRLCVHERDWRVGEQIVDQIDASVLNSRRVIIILSKHFIDSMWSSIEFKTAHYHSLQEKNNRIIVIVMGELPAKDKLDSDLRMHINLNTYLQWGDKQFWEKLRYAMPQKRKKSSVGSITAEMRQYFIQLEPMNLDECTEDSIT